MGRNKNKGRYRVLALVWSFAAASMFMGVTRTLPDVNPMALVILVLSGAAAAIWWKAYLKAAKATFPNLRSAGQLITATICPCMA